MKGTEAQVKLLHKEGSNESLAWLVLYLELVDS